MTDDGGVFRGRLPDGTIARLERVGGGSWERRETFDRIYRGNLWNGAESRSGPGSGDAATARLRRDLVALVDDLGIRRVLDVGCGDGYWFPDVPDYLGVDVSGEAIDRARARHPDRRYRCIDPATMPLPRGADLVVLRDVVQHLSLRDGMAVLAAIVGARPRYLLASSYRGGENVDIRTGEAYAPDLERAPFDLGAPERWLFDGWHYHPTDEVRDPRKYLGLWRLGT